MTGVLSRPQLSHESTANGLQETLSQPLHSLKNIIRYIKVCLLSPEPLKFEIFILKTLILKVIAVRNFICIVLQILKTSY